MDKLSVLIADDHGVVRGGLRHLLSEEFSGTEFKECSNGADTIIAVNENHCDLILLDISLPDQNGLDVLKLIKDKQPGVPVIILTVFKEEQYATRAFQLGASGYLQKATATDELIKAVKTVLSGQKYVSSAFTDHMIANISGNSSESKLSLLSEREHSIMLMIVNGNSLKEIGYKLNLSPKTVTTYRSRILDKLNLESNAALVQYAIANGLIQ